MITLKSLSGIFMIALFVSCAPLKAPSIVRNEPLESYKYFYITPTGNLTSGTGAIYGSYGSTTSKTVNPGDVISGILMKEGFVGLPDLKPELSSQTLIVNYGESGRRNRGMGYTIEVTIQFISAKNNSPICLCTAEGQGETEADDIRQAITRCLSGLLAK